MPGASGHSTTARAAGASAESHEPFWLDIFTVGVLLVRFPRFGTQPPSAITP
jgi:hypothetical protein